MYRSRMQWEGHTLATGSRQWAIGVGMRQKRTRSIRHMRATWSTPRDVLVAALATRSPPPQHNASCFGVERSAYT